MNDVRSIRLMIGLLTAAWVIVGASIALALIQTGALGDPISLVTLFGIVVGAVGLVGTWSFRKWGPVFYLAANVLLIVKPCLFGTAAGGQGIGWGYWLLLALFLALVASHWAKFKG